MTAVNIRPVGGMTLEQALAIAMNAAPKAVSSGRAAWDEDAELCVRDGHAEGLTDHAIADRHEISQPVVSRLRNKLGLSGNGKYLKAGSPESIALDKAVGDLVRDGALDTTIATTLGITRSQAKHRRTRQGLPANGPDGQPLPNPLARNADKQAKAKRVTELHGKGWRDREIGTDIGVSERQVAHYRKALGLEAIPR